MRAGGLPHKTKDEADAVQTSRAVAHSHTGQETRHPASSLTNTMHPSMHPSPCNERTAAEPSWGTFYGRRAEETLGQSE